MTTYCIGNGFVSQHLPYPKITTRLRPDNDLIRNMLAQYKPTCLINTIGYCGVRNIDDCEVDKEKTLTSNTIIPIMIANECEKQGIHFIHIGSGCCYYGRSPNLKTSPDVQFDRDVGQLNK